MQSSEMIQDLAFMYESMVSLNTSLDLKTMLTRLFETLSRKTGAPGIAFWESVDSGYRMLHLHGKCSIDPQNNAYGKIVEQIHAVQSTALLTAEHPGFHQFTGRHLLVTALGEDRLILSFSTTTSMDLSRISLLLGGLSNHIGHAIKACRSNAMLQELISSLEERVNLEVQKNREKEKFLIEKSRLAALGEMIVAISHQWRQPLNAIGIIIQDLEDAFLSNELSKDYFSRSVTETMNQVGFMSRTIDDFRNFFRRSETRECFDVTTALDKTLAIVAASFAHNSIDIHLKHVGKGVLFCSGFPGEFEQAIMNILLNSRDAILERSQGASEKGRVDIEIRPTGEQIVLQISDNGTGIGATHIDRIFDPYFSTRGPQGGSGIGLYMVHSIITKNMQGKVHAANLSVGARITIELPRCHPDSFTERKMR